MGLLLDPLLEHWWGLMWVLLWDPQLVFLLEILWVHWLGRLSGLLSVGWWGCLWGH